MSEAKIKCAICGNDATKYVRQLADVETTLTNTGAKSQDTMKNVPYCDEHFHKIKEHRPWTQATDVYPDTHGT